MLLLLIFMGTLIAAKLESLNDESFGGPFRAVDGDTLASGSARFRLLGIDAPELRQTCEDGDGEWNCGQAARAFVADALKGATAECAAGKKDKYARYLVRCTLDGKDLGGMVVSAGLAVRTDYFLYAAEEDQAQARKIGLWSGTFERPQAWRREHKAAEMDAPMAGMLTILRHVLGW